jgi:hypothetical protein
MDISEAIEKALVVFANHENSNDEDLEKALEKMGIPLSLAYKLSEFMPLAFGRIFMKDLGVAFQQDFVRYVISEGKIVKKHQAKLDNEVVYKEAYKIASRMFSKRISVEEFQVVAFRSAEFRVVNEMLNKGSKPENIVLTQPYLQWREDIEEKEEFSDSNQSQSWWQFWK